MAIHYNHTFTDDMSNFFSLFFKNSMFIMKKLRMVSQLVIMGTILTYIILMLATLKLQHKPITNISNYNVLSKI